MSSFEHEQPLNPPYDVLEITQHAQKALNILQGIIIRSDDVLYGFRGRSSILCRPNLAQQRGSVVPDTRHTQVGDVIEIIVEPQATLEHAEQYEEHKVDVAKTLIAAGVAKALYGWNLSHELGNMDDNDRIKAMIEVNDRHYDKKPLYAAARDTQDEYLEGFIERMGEESIARVNLLRFSFGAALRHVINGQLQTKIAERARLLLKENLHMINLEFDVEAAWNSLDAAFKNYDDKIPHIELSLGYPMSPAEEAEFVREL